jgi:ribosomal protein S7
MDQIHEFAFSLMMKGRNNGKKLLAVRIVAHAFEIIHLLTDQNPIQVTLLLHLLRVVSSTCTRCPGPC